MKRYHLLHHRGYLENWSVMDITKENYGASFKDKVSISGVDDVLQEDSMEELFLDLQKDNTYEWYAVLSHIDSKNKRREEKYPHFRNLFLINGVVPEVCGFRLDDNCYLTDWQVDYIREIWVRDNENSMQKVLNLTDKMDELALEWIKRNGLKRE